MPPFIACDSCGAQLKIKEDLVGKKIKCPKCAHVVRIPAPAVEGPITLKLAEEPTARKARDDSVTAARPEKKRRPLPVADDDDDDGTYRPAGLRRDADRSRAMKAGITPTQTVIILISSALALAALGLFVYFFVPVFQVQPAVQRVAPVQPPQIQPPGNDKK